MRGKREFYEIELLDPYGNPTGCFRWARPLWLCDHEHDEGDPMCEDAAIEMCRPYS